MPQNTGKVLVSHVGASQKAIAYHRPGRPFYPCNRFNYPLCTRKYFARADFCFFNNVAIAAKYALMRHQLERVAIIDFDVHHGNGTEDICAGDPNILMCSIFQHPFFPFSGDKEPAANMVNVPVPAYTKGMDVREIVEMYWIPRLEEFKPQMIFISAGFDAHREDDMGQLGLVESDYAWMTHRIKDIARRFSKGRIVSCLEGGYVMAPLAASVEAHIRVLADL